MIDYTVEEINSSNINAIKEIVDESVVNGIKFEQRMWDEWQSGQNCFTKKGEKLIGLFHEGKCFAVGGIQVDPYIADNDGSIGRVRGIYVKESFRKQGFAKIILDLLVSHGRNYFKAIGLSTTNPIASHMYEEYGFEKNGEEKNGRQEYILKI